MSDVIDDDLLKELGLDEQDLKEIELKKKPIERPSAPKAEAKPSAAAASSLDFEDEIKAPVPKQTVSRPIAKPPAPHQQDEVQKPAPKPSMMDFNESLAKDVPVQLAAVLAKKTLNLGQILELRVGEVLELTRKPTDPIDLVANGKLVAKAELVMIDGQIGVRILKLMR